MDAISVVSSGLLSAPPPPSEKITAMVHEGTLVATDGTNVMAMDNTNSGLISIGPLSDFSQIDNTVAKPSPMHATVDVLTFGAGVFMIVDRDGVSYWSDDLGVNWTLGTGYDPAFNSATMGYFIERMSVFWHNNHQNTYSFDGKVKINGQAIPQTIAGRGGMTQLDFDGSTFTYALMSQRFAWYNTGTDYTTGWAQITRGVNRDSWSIATDGNVVANLQAWEGAANPGLTYVRSSSDGITFGSDFTTTGIDTMVQARHIMWHHGEWMIINALGGVWTSDNLVDWTSQGSSYLTGTPSGLSNADDHGMENQNIIRWGAGEGQNKENFAIFFDNQIYQSTTT